MCDRYLDYHNKILEQKVKPCSTLLGAFLKTNGRGLSSPYGQQFELYHIYKDSWVPSVGKEFVCNQDHSNEPDMHAVAVHRDKDSGDVLG